MFNVLMSSPYTLNYVFAEEHDLCFYEVKRNENEVAFTVVVRNFSIVGHKQFFKDIFASSCWDRERKSEKSTDLDFLVGAWKHFGLQGQFEPPKKDEVLLEASVYRRPMDEIIARLSGGGE